MNRLSKGKLQRCSLGQWVSPLLLAVAFLALLLLTAKITIYCDDYFYGLFFRDGWNGFWDLTIWHYLNFNGRAFVHFMAQVALIFDTKLFILLNPLMLAVAFLLGSRLQSGETPWRILLSTSAVGMMVVMALPIQFLNTSLLWISAAFNYLFPIFFLMLVLWRHQRDTEKGRLHPLTMLLIFLAGATTEQSGLAAIVCLGGWSFLCYLRKKIPLWQGFLPILLSGAGYASVIFAPGTWVRVGNERGGGFLSFLADPAELLARFRLATNFFTGEQGVPLLILLLCLLLAAHALLTRRAPKVLLSGGVVAVAYFLLRQGGHPLAANLLAVLFLLFAALVSLLWHQTTLRGLLMLGMLASQLVMILNSSAAPRTAVPAILLLLIVCISLLAECLECLKGLPSWGVPLLAAAAMAALCPLYLTTYQGYAANQVVNLANEQALRQHDQEPIVLSLDLSQDYRHLMFFESRAYMDYALEYYGVTSEKISYTSSNLELSGLYNGQRAGLPAFRDGDTLFLPIQDIAQLCGGDGEWNYVYHGTVIWLDQRSYLFLPSGEVYRWDLATQRPVGQAIYSDVRSFYTYYAPAELFQQFFGITTRYDPVENIYYIQQEELPS